MKNEENDIYDINTEHLSDDIIKVAKKLGLDLLSSERSLEEIGKELKTNTTSIKRTEIRELKTSKKIGYGIDIKKYIEE